MAGLFVILVTTLALMNMLSDYVNNPSLENNGMNKKH